MTTSTDPTPFTERMNELIAWAEERAAEHETDAAEWDYGSREWADHEGAGAAFREIANHLRQLSQGAKMKGELKEAVERLAADANRLEQRAGYAVEFGTPGCRGANNRFNRNFAADLRLALAALSQPVPARGEEGVG